MSAKSKEIEGVVKEAKKFGEEEEEEEVDDFFDDDSIMFVAKTLTMRSSIWK